MDADGMRYFFHWYERWHVTQTLKLFLNRYGTYKKFVMVISQNFNFKKSVILMSLWVQTIDIAILLLLLLFCNEFCKLTCGSDHLRAIHETPAQFIVLEEVVQGLRESEKILHYDVFIIIVNFKNCFETAITYTHSVKLPFSLLFSRK